MLLSEYLRARELSLSPTPVELSDEETINTHESIAQVWGSGAETIRFVVQRRIDAIKKQIVETCAPEEVIVLRQSIVELGALIDDFEGISASERRRKEEADKEKEEEADETPIDEEPTTS